MASPVPPSAVSIGAAQAALVEILRQIDGGTYIPPSRTTVAEFLHEWMLARDSVRPTTQCAYRHAIERYVIPHIGQTPVQTLTPLHLNALYGDLRVHGGQGGRPLSGTTVRFVHATLHTALTAGVKWGVLMSNVADRADPPRRSWNEMKTWSVEQVKSFLAHVRDHNLYAFWVLALTTGMRRGEMLGLKWYDLDVEQSRIAVMRSLAPDGELYEPKTARGKRLLALDAETLRVMLEHRHRQLVARMATSGPYVDESFIFCRPDGSALDPELVSTMFRRLNRSSHLQYIRLHDLRHTYASLALRAGVHPKVVSERLGHSSVSITLDTYSHAVPALQEEAAEHVASLIFG